MPICLHQYHFLIPCSINSAVVKWKTKETIKYDHKKHCISWTDEFIVTTGPYQFSTFCPSACKTAPSRWGKWNVPLFRTGIFGRGHETNQIYEEQLKRKDFAIILSCTMARTRAHSLFHSRRAARKATCVVTRDTDACHVTNHKPSIQQ